MAYELSQPDPAKFEQSLNDAHRSLYNVQKYLATGYEGKSRDLLQTALSVADLADSIFKSMKKSYDEANLEQPKKRTIDG